MKLKKGKILAIKKRILSSFLFNLLHYYEVEICYF